MYLTAMYLTVIVLSMALGATVDHLISGLYSCNGAGSAPVGFECRKTGRPIMRELKNAPGMHHA